MSTGVVGCDCVSALVLRLFRFCRWGCDGEGSYRLGGACCRLGLAEGLAPGAGGVLVAGAVRRVALHACVRILPSFRTARILPHLVHCLRCGWSGWLLSASGELLAGGACCGGAHLWAYGLPSDAFKVTSFLHSMHIALGRPDGDLVSSGMMLVTGSLLL